jgi:uncharacterized protein (DUF305 family)
MNRPHQNARQDAAGSAFGAEMAQAMDRMMQAMHRAGHGDDPDQAFLAMMIPHHQGAIDMAALALRHGRDPLVRQLAGEIIAAQQAEISSMQARLAALERGDDEYPALTGTRGN